MSEDVLIYKRKLIKDILDLPDCYNGFSDTFDKSSIIGVIDEQQTIAPVKHGYWELSEDGWSHQCSVCGKPSEETVTGGDLFTDDPSGETGGYFKNDYDEFLSPYCPYCGAKLEWVEDGDEEDEDEEDGRHPDCPLREVEGEE